MYSGDSNQHTHCAYLTSFQYMYSRPTFMGHILEVPYSSTETQVATTWPHQRWIDIPSMFVTSSRLLVCTVILNCECVNAVCFAPTSTHNPWVKGVYLCLDYDGCTLGDVISLAPSTQLKEDISIWVKYSCTHGHLHNYNHLHFEHVYVLYHHLIVIY